MCLESELLYPRTRGSVDIGVCVDINARTLGRRVIVPKVLVKSVALWDAVTGTNLPRGSKWLSLSSLTLYE